MVIDSVILGKFGRQVRRKYIYEVGILIGDFCRSLLGNEARYMKSTGKMNIELKQGEAGKCNITEWSDGNYVGLILRVKRYSCKLFFIH